ncbi:MAG: hypothetical protein HQL09_01430 [Nitrospirae bacterium]|nr:hypothetical protein [Nitrospirota bacterium]
MTKTIIVVGLILVFVAGSAFAMMGGGGHGSTQDCQMENGQMSGSMDQGAMDHASMPHDSMDHGSMNNQNMQMDQGGMSQDEQNDQSGKMHGTPGSGRN